MKIYVGYVLQSGLKLIKRSSTYNVWSTVVCLKKKEKESI